MPAKMAQISPLGRRSGCQDYGRRPRRQAVLSKRGNSAKIHPGLGFIWGIPDKTSRKTRSYFRSQIFKPIPVIGRQFINSRIVARIEFQTGMPRAI